MSLKVKSQNPDNVVDTELRLLHDAKDGVVYLVGNNVRLAWFDENDLTLNLLAIKTDDQANLPGLGFSENSKLRVYGE